MPARAARASTTLREAAEYLRVCPQTVYRLVRRGAIPHTRVGNSLRFRTADLDAYLSAQTSRTWQRVDRRGRPSAREELTG